eukprot:m51a1_g4091 hypothetical protein (147) ;mRNA; f:62372-63082
MMCLGPGSEHYDSEPFIYRPVLAYDNGIQKPCPGYPYTVTMAQLFTPPHVPWQFTRVCVALGGAKVGEYDISGTISVYPVVVTKWGLVPGPRQSSVGFTKRLKSPAIAALDPNYTYWTSIDASDLAQPLGASPHPIWRQVSDLRDP